MPDPDQMSWEDLLEAKEQVERQLERLRYGPAFLFPVWGRVEVGRTRHKRRLELKLTEILDQINYELEHPSA